MIPSFAERQRAWSSPPVDGVGYFPASELLAYDDDALKALIEIAEMNRYHGWRNYKNRWRDVLGLDATHGKQVLDYGCGIGIEALQYAKAGNVVMIADIAWDNVQVANRVLNIHGYRIQHRWTLKARRPFLKAEPGTIDVIHCAGVLHHIPRPERVVERMAELLKSKGELRLMVYSDKAWRIATDSEPPANPEKHPRFDRYWSFWDPHGGYADWYDQARLEQRFGEWFRVARCEPLTERGEYLGAVLVKR